MLLRMAWRNLWRNPRRTFVVLGALSIGIAGCVLSMAINLGMVKGMVDTAIRGGLGHLQVHASGWDADPQLEVRLADGGVAVEAAFDGVQEIEHWAPRLRAQGLVASARASVGVSIAGVDPEREGSVTTLPGRVREGRFLSVDGRREIVLGGRLAKILSAEVGDEVLLYSVAYSMETAYELFRVVGVMRLPELEMDRSLAVISLFLSACPTGLLSWSNGPAGNATTNEASE